MTLWNIIRDFFVEYVFGGTTSTGLEINDNFIGNLMSFSDEYGEPMDTFNTTITIDSLGSGGSFGYLPEISIGDWLSTTATIITLIGLFIAITMFIIKLVKWISNTIAMR